ncbi:hypothetical protein TRVA0_005S03466 [Trichomonascus vanleenenianus]|uniref:Rgr1p n=1 Tax=Trichomonascus vanleenenianus TaxID=2268995 RepID=UPI003EC9EB8D
MEPAADARTTTDSLTAMKEQAHQQLQNLTAAPRIPHITENYVPLAHVTGNLVHHTYGELRNLLETLPAVTSDLSRKRRLLDFIIKSRQEFVKLYVLTKWAVASGDVAQCIDVVAWLSAQQNCYTNVVNVLYTIERDLGGAKLRNPDIETALEVLKNGRPFQLSHGYVTLRPLSAKKVLKTLTSLNVLLSIRLALTEELPPLYRNYHISNGKVKFSVENSFTVDLGIADDAVDARFFLVDFAFCFDGAKAMPLGVRTKVEKIVNSMLSTRRLAQVFDWLLKFAQNYKLAVIHERLTDLEGGLWANVLRHVFYPDKSLIVVQYWVNRSGPRSMVEIGLQRSNILGVRWTRDGQLVSDHGLEFGQRHLAVEWLLSEVIDLHVRYIIETVYYGLATLLYGPRAQEMLHRDSLRYARSLDSSTNTMATPASNNNNNNNSNNAAALNAAGAARFEPHSAALKGSVMRPSNNDNNFANNNDSGAAAATGNNESLNNDATTDDNNNNNNNDKNGSEEPLLVLLAPNRLKIQLTNTRYTVFSIDPQTGRAVLQNSTQIVMAAERSLNELPDRVSQAAGVLYKLRHVSLQDEITTRAKATGWVYNSNVAIASDDVRTHFSADTKIVFALRLPSWSLKWFLLVSINGVTAPQWWISQLEAKDDVWRIQFVEHIDVGRERTIDYKLFDDLALFVTRRTRVEPFTNQLKERNVRFQVLQDRLASNRGAPLVSIDLPTLLVSNTSWAHSTLVLSAVGSTVLLQGRTRHQIALNSVPSTDSGLVLDPKKGKFSIVLNLTSQEAESGFIDCVIQRLGQIERIVSYTDLIKSMKLELVNACMDRVTFEYGPSLQATVVLSNSTAESDDISLELSRNSPHYEISQHLQEVLKQHGLRSVIWLLQTTLPIYETVRTLRESTKAQGIIIIPRSVTELSIVFMHQRVKLQAKVLKKRTQAPELFVSDVMDAINSLTGLRKEQEKKATASSLGAIWTAAANEIAGVVPLVSGVACPIGSFGPLINMIAGRFQAQQAQA